MFCDILTPDGEPSLGDPRHVLKRTLAKAKDKGFTFYVHPEIEFYLFESQDDWSKAPTPIEPRHGLPPRHREHARANGHLGGILAP